MAVSPVHVDAHYAEAEMVGGHNLVVGTFVYAALVGMSLADTSGKALAALGTEGLRHVAPLYHGDTLYAESVGVEARQSSSRPGTGVVTIDTRGFKQDETTVCEFRRSFLVPLRESA